MKPQLAEDAILDKLQLPCWEEPKIDGVRALNTTGTLTGRSLDPFEGYGITEYFSRSYFNDLDGEMTLGFKPNCTNRLCSLTTGAMGRFKGVTEMADLHWWLFDYLEYPELSYENRYGLLLERLLSIEHPRLHLVPFTVCHTMDDVNAAIARNSANGYEGTILRNPKAVYKPGRATKKHQELWRVKPWADSEMLVTGFTEGQSNGNEAKTNSLGRTERSSAKAGMVPNGMVGSIQGTLLQDVYDQFTGKLLFAKGLPIAAGSGEMSTKEAKYYWEHPEELVGHYAKIRHMAHGVKTYPRFPTFVSKRLKEDM